MSSDILSDAVDKIERCKRERPDTYASLISEISVVKTVMDSLRMLLDAAPGQSAEFEKLVEELRTALRAVDVSRLVEARERLLAFVTEAHSRLPQPPDEDKGDSDEPSHDGWLPIGSVTIDTARLLLLDPIHQGRVNADAADGQIAIPGGDFSAVQVPTGIGDGRYRVEGRVIESPMFGRRLAEIRVRFLDEDGNWLGADAPATSDEPEGRQ
jgi:hypothetical protein